MGMVYKARDTRLNRPVALKFLPPELTRDKEAKQRFIHEAQTASALDHNNICTIHEIDETKDQQLFICMAYYDGETLKSKIQKDPLPIKEAIQIAIQILHGLARAHEVGMIHRDIKPANIMITNRGEVRIVDFGLAKLVGQTSLTKPGTTPGTVAYMSPEQIHGENIDSRTDLWSVGVVLYEMLTGRLPFQSDNDQVILYSILNEDPPVPSQLNKEIPWQLDQIIQNCLKKDVAARYQNAIDLEIDLHEVDNLLEKPKISKKSKKILLRPSQRNKISYVLITTLIIFFIIILLLDRLVFRKFLGTDTIPTTKHLALLPCVNIGEHPLNQALCDGLTEILTSQLTLEENQDIDLWIVPFSEIRSRKVGSVKEANELFAVNIAITSSLLQEPDNIKLTLNMVNADNLRQIRSVVLDIPTADIHKLPIRAMLHLADMLELEFDLNRPNLLAMSSPENPQAYEAYLKGRGYLQNYGQKENIDTAIVFFQKSIDINPDYALAFTGIGEAYWRKYRATKDPSWLNKALVYGKTALHLNNQIPAVLVTMGYIQLEKGSDQDASESFQAALKIDSLNYQANKGLAKIYENQNQLSQAEHTYQKAIRMRPGYWGNHNALGVFYYKQGRYEEALQQFKLVVSLTPQNIMGYNNLGGLFFYLKRWDEAKECFEQAISIKPNYRSLCNLGTLYFYENRYTDAAEMYQKALEITDTDYRVWSGLAESYYWIPKKRDESKTIFLKTIAIAEKQLQVNPQDLLLASELASYYARIGNHAKAESYLLDIISKDPVSIDVMFHIAGCYEQMGQRELALNWLEKTLVKGFSLAEIEQNPSLKLLRSDPRYKKILENTHQK